MLGRFDDAERVVDALQALVCADPQKGDRNVSVLAEMSAMISLHRGRSGEQEAYGNIPQQLAKFMAAATYAADGRKQCSTSKFTLQAPTKTGQEQQQADTTR